MAIRTKRARMLYKLMYLLGPVNEQYLKNHNQKPYTFTGAVRKTLAIYGYSPYNTVYLGCGGSRYDKVEKQLIEDYANLLSQISDDNI